MPEIRYTSLSIPGKLAFLSIFFSHETKGQSMSTEKTSYLFDIANCNMCELCSPLKPERAGIV